MKAYFQPGIFWLHPNVPSVKSTRQRGSLPSRLPSRLTEQQLQVFQDAFSAHCPITLIVPNENDRRRTRGISFIQVKSSFCQNSFIPLGQDVYVACPELTLLLMAPTLNDYELLYFAYELCSGYALDPSSKTGLSKRAPLTSVDKLRTYAESRPGLYHSQRTLKLLRHVRDGALSPREIECMLHLSLPHKLGGCNLKGLELNRQVKMKPGSSTERRYCDIFLPKSQTTLEYLGVDYHAGAREMLVDAHRTVELAEKGVQVIKITKNTLSSATQMNELAKVLAAREGQRFRPRSGNFVQSQERMRRIVLQHQGRYFAQKTWVSKAVKQE